jgi:hypothetical protein
MTQTLKSKSRKAVSIGQTVTEAHRLIIEIIRQIIEEKASRLKAKGFIYISSKEVYRHCLEMLGNENKCVGITTYAARFLNSYAVRLDTYTPKWRITTTLLEKLFSTSKSYEKLREKPLNKLNSIDFLRIVTSLLYEAKPEGEEDGGDSEQRAC